jgi:release factor glutamine methyltransferase
MNYAEASRRLTESLSTVYEQGEAAAMAEWVMEYLTGLKRADRLLHAQNELTAEQTAQYNNYCERLLQQEPLQYVLQEAWFAGLKFYVDPNVLIPRPETEELLEWIVSSLKFPLADFSILDIGTGSGCIAIALKRRLRKATVIACDISEKALAVAQRNAGELHAAVQFKQLDFLNPDQRNILPVVDILVSNPPYIPEAGKTTMPANVVNHEPHTALFVPDHDPLVFYNAIADFAVTHLAAKGQIFMETHEELAGAVKKMFEEAGFTATLKKDLQGKERMVNASR